MPIPEITFSKNDMSLIEEAVRRVVSMRGNAGADPDLVARAVRAEAARGTRNLFGLVKVGARAGSGQLS